MQPKVGGKFHLKLNTDERPIANKYREGKMKRTLKRELKVLEIVRREAIEFSISQGEESIRFHLMKYNWEVSWVSLFEAQLFTGLKSWVRILAAGLNLWVRSECTSSLIFLWVNMSSQSGKRLKKKVTSLDASHEDCWVKCYSFFRSSFSPGFVDWGKKIKKERVLLVGRASCCGSLFVRVRVDN